MTDTNILTVNEFLQFAPEVDTSRFDVPTISGMISQGSKAVADYLEYTPYAEDIVNEVKEARITTDGDLLIFPQKLPVATVSAISLFKGTVSVNLSLQDGSGNDRFNIDYTKRHIRYPYSELTTNSVVLLHDFMSLRSSQFYVKMSYRGGWEVSALPASIKQALVLMVKDIFANQYNQMGANRLRQGSVEFAFGSGGISESKFIKDAHRLLNPYRRIG